MVIPTYCLLPNWPLFRKPNVRKLMRVVDGDLDSFA